jgi:small subunit ribosomal protein S1
MEENQIVNSNAEGQEPTADTAVATATTTAPAENGNGKKWPAPTPHDDFDWTIDKRNVAAYKKEEK